MVPADERFEPFQPFFGKAVERLEIQLELAIVYGAAKVEFHLSPLPRLLVQRGFEKVVARLAFALGAIKREIGVLHQRDAVLPVIGRDGDAQAGRAIRLLPLDLDPAGEGFLHRGRHGIQVGFRPDSIDQHGKFIPAEARDDRFGMLFGQEHRDLSQQRISCRVTQRVVDDLEIVEVGIDDHDPVVRLPPCQCQR